MAIFDYDGTTNHEIGKLYDYDGTTNNQVGKIYDYDGTTNSLIYTAEEVLLDGSTGASSWSLSKEGGKGAFTATTDGLKLTATGNGGDDWVKGTATLHILYDLASLNNLEYSIYAIGSKSHKCNVYLVNPSGVATHIKTIYDIGANKNGGGTTYNGSINISSYTGSYMIRFVIEFGAYHGKTGYQTIKKCVLK